MGLTVFRWSTKHPLHVSANPTPASGSSSPTTSSPTRTTRPPSSSRSASSPATTLPSDRSAPDRHRGESVVSLDDSHIEDPAPGGAGAGASASGSSFTTALAMLLYNVCYLAHTQAVEVPLAQAGEVLGNLWAVCCSPELGRCVARCPNPQ